MRWERTFEFSASIDTVWDAFTNPEAEYRVINKDNPYLSNGAVRMEFTDEVTRERLAWTEIEGDKRWDMAVTFEATDSGCTITLVRSGFGEGDEWMIAATSRLLGWEQVFADVEVYFRTGIRPTRFYSNAWMTCGLYVVAEGGGVRVAGVLGDSLAKRAGVRVGDTVLTIAGYPTFSLSDFWMVERFVRARDGEIAFEFIRDGAIETASATREAVPA